MKQFAVFSYYGGWNRLFQFPVVNESRTEWLMRKAVERYPKARLIIKEVND